MKLKRFNEYSELEVGDYVYITSDDMFFNNGVPQNIRQEYIDFLKNNIGQVVEIELYIKKVKVKYNNVPKILNWFFSDTGTSYFDLHKIKYYSKNIEDIKIQIDSEKYNI